MKIKTVLLALILTLTIASATPADAITIFGKELNFGKVFSSKAKTGTPVSSVVGTHPETAYFTISFPKTDSVLTAGQLYTIKWKSSNAPTSSYPLSLVNTVTKKEISLGKALGAEGVFTFALDKDMPAGKYKVVFGGKNGAESAVFQIQQALVLQNVSMLESFAGDAVPLNTAVNVNYRLTLFDKSAPATFKLTCPANVSAKYLNIERCNTTLPLSVFTPSTFNSYAYYLTLAYTNTGSASAIVTMDGYVGSKAIGKVINRVDATKVIPASTFKFTSPTANQNWLLGRNYDITWTGTDTVVDTYTVYVVGGFLGNDKNNGIIVGTVKANQGTYSFRVLTLLQPEERYQVIFSAPGVGDKRTEFFTAKSSTNVPLLTKVSSTVTTLKTNNVDVAVNASFKMNIQPKGNDIPVSSLTAVVGLKNTANGEVITTRSVNGITESGFTYINDGSIKPLEFSATFASSTFPFGFTTVSAFIQSLTYKPGPTAATSTMTDGLNLFDSNNYTSFEKNSPTPAFTRNLTIGDSGADVLLLKKVLAAKGYAVGTTTDYFGPELKSAVASYQVSVRITPVDGYFGPLTRMLLNAEIATSGKLK